MERKVFRGIGAVIASVTDDYAFKVFAVVDGKRKVDYTRIDRLIEVDLRLTPGLAPQWADVRFDDRGITASGAPQPVAMSPKELKGFAITSLSTGPFGQGLGPQLERGCYVGGVYVEDTHFNGLLGRINDDPNDPWPSAGWARYELTTIHYSSNAINGALVGKRYAGVHGLIRRRSGTFAQIELLKIGRRGPQPPDFEVLGTWWFDQSSPDECEPAPPNDGEPLLDVNSPVGAEGGIYLELGLLAALGASGPKIPKGLPG